MLGKDMVEAPDHLYQEGNIIGKHKQKRNNNQLKKKTDDKNKNEKRIHKYQRGDLGSLIDVEV